MAKESLFTEAEMFTYEEYCVFELIKGKDKGISLSGHKMGQERPFPYDLYAPDGIPSLAIRGKTAIYVKQYLSYATINETDSYFKSYGDKYNLLVVYFKSSVSNLPISKPNEYGKLICYLSYKELKDKYKKRSDTGKSDYYAQRTKGDWRQERDELIKKAHNSVSQGSNVLFLGAGVSMSADMPSWKELLKGLMGEVKQLKQPTLEAFKELSSHVLEECGDSNLIMGRYLQTAISLYDNKAVFSELIQKHLYGKKDTSPLLLNLARIVQQKKVNEVITYNFDDLLEQNLVKMRLTDSVDFTAISKDAEVKGHNTLPIYHVHGIIPRNGAVDTVVFSEEEYHKRYYTAYHWSNVEQLHALSRMHCFFIGLSMTDPNLRRLLDTAKEMNKANAINHYAFLKRTQLEKYCVSDMNKTCRYVHVSESLIDKKKQKEIYDLNYAVIESIFMELGVNVIWYENHDELPGLIAQVFGVSYYEGMDNDALISLCEKKIKEIQSIESELFILDKKRLDLLTIYKKMSSAPEKTRDYRKCISEAEDMLSVLSNRIKWEESGEDKPVKEAPQYDNIMNGYGDFFKIWLENVKRHCKL